MKAGETVSKGQQVAELSRKDLAAQRERDALTVLKAEAALADLVSGAREQEIKQAALAVEAAETNLDQAVADHKKALADYERLEALYEAEAISLSEYETAANKLEAAKTKLSLLESGNRPAQIDPARVDVERSRAVLQATEALLADLIINSPLDGQVLSVNYEAGEFVTPGAPVATIADLSDMTTCPTSKWVRRSPVP